MLHRLWDIMFSRVQKSHSEKYPPALLDSLLEGCQLISRDWKYLYVNDAVVHQSRTTKERLLHCTMMECFPGFEDTEVFKRLKKCMEDRIPDCMENQFEFPDKRVGWFELRMEPVPEGMFILSLDITERKKLELAKSEFISLASHQLRTPLAAMKWTLNLFIKDTDLSDIHKKRIDHLYTSNERLIALVEDLLNVSRIESGNRFTKPENVLLSPLVEASLHMLRPRAEAKKQIIDVLWPAADYMLHIDPTLFAETFDNLLGNAIEYGFPDSTITVSITREGEKVVISIHNRGISILPDDAPHIFTKFYRGENARTVRHTSSGLGLFIAKSAAIQNGGMLRFTSSKERGTTFSFSVPYITN